MVGCTDLSNGLSLHMLAQIILNAFPQLVGVDASRNAENFVWQNTTDHATARQWRCDIPSLVEHGIGKASRTAAFSHSKYVLRGLLTALFVQEKIFLRMLTCRAHSEANLIKVQPLEWTIGRNLAQMGGSQTILTELGFGWF